LANLKESYANFAEWSLADVPDVVATEIRTVAQGYYQNLLPTGQQAVLRELQKGDEKESPARWLQVAEWAPASTELQTWQSLAMVLLRLTENKPEEPTAALVKFLKTTQFNLNFTTMRLQIPDDLKTNLQPSGKLSLYLKTSDNTATLNFKKDREDRDPRSRVTTYDFVPEGPATLAFHPGETIWANLVLRDAANTIWEFTWSQCRSSVFEFERLSRSPRLHTDVKGNVKGELAEGARLLIPGYPRVPDLLPVVK
jgi:hypothetical protein